MHGLSPDSDGFGWFGLYGWFMPQQGNQVGDVPLHFAAVNDLVYRAFLQ